VNDRSVVASLGWQRFDAPPYPISGAPCLTVRDLFDPTVIRLSSSEAFSVPHVNSFKPKQARLDIHPASVTC
jgi:hypothetical protein